MADAAVETVTSGAITITYTGAGASWDSTSHFPGGLLLNGIEVTGSPGDKVVVRNGSATGGVISTVVVDNDGVGHDYWGHPTWAFPYIYLTDLGVVDITKVSCVVRYI